MNAILNPMATPDASESTPRIVVYGIGAMGGLIVRMLSEKGIDVAGAIARSPAKVGRDVGELAGLQHKTGVIVESDVGEVLERVRPTLVIMTMASYMHDMEVPTLTCIEAGANVISLSEELLHSWNTAPEATARIDAAAKRRGVTFVSTGQQDGYWVSLVAVLMGTAHRIDQVKGLATWNVDDFGAELARDQNVGMTVAEFGDWVSKAQRPPTFGRTALELLARVVGLGIGEASTVTRPELAPCDMYCTALDLTIKQGDVIGFTDVDTVTTDAGIDLVLEMTGRVYSPAESDVNVWRILGDPDLNIRSDVLPTHMTTCATLVNRIPDVLAARPGYLTLSDLGQLTYRHRLTGPMY